MATSDILGLFTTPEQYQQAQQQAQQAQAIQFANLDPMARANYGTFLAGQRLGGAIGGALGGQDPQLKLISQRQQILGMIDPTNPDSFAQGIQMALQTGDTQTAFLLRNEMMKAKEQAQQQEIRGFEREKFLLDRGMTMQQRGMEAAALSIANGIDPQTGLRGKSILNEQGEVIDTQALKPLIDPTTQKFNQDVANKLISEYGQVGVNIVKQRLEGVQGVESLQEKQLAKDRVVKANELFATLRKDDGTINETVKAELLSFPEGRALITQQAEVLKPLRQLGAGVTPEVNPFDFFVNDPKLPATLKAAARQYQKAFNEGTYSPEDVDKFVERLASKAESSAQYQQTSQRLENIAQESLDLRKQLAAQAKADAGGSDKVQASKVTPDGTVILVFKNGKTSVTSPQGEQLTGQARADAIRNSEQFGSDVQGERAQSRGLGDLTAKQVGQAFAQIGKIKTNLGNIDDAIKAIDAGANTGVIASKLPNISAASVQLANIRNTLGLDVIGSVTFGALSEGELNLALDTALPTNLAPKDLRKYLVDKKTAQTKLAGYLTEQATYLSKKGNSLAGWLEKVENQAPPADVRVRRRQNP
jgi:hypothetical protein